MSYLRNSVRVTRVSSAATNGTSLSTRSARRVMSSRLPIGVATTYRVPNAFEPSKFPDVYKSGPSGEAGFESDRRCLSSKHGQRFPALEVVQAQGPPPRPPVGGGLSSV